jgi:hypothetical protein
MTIHTNSGLKLYMESARGSALPISAITKAAPGVITSAGHGLSTGDVVALEILGMEQLDGRAFQVTVIDADTFKLDEKDGTNFISTASYDTFTSGNAYKITLGTTINGVQEFSSSGGDPKYLDTTTVNDKDGKQQANGTNPITYSMVMQWDPGDSAQDAMIEASRTSSEKVFKILWPTGRFMLFVGSISYAGVPGGATQGVTTSSAGVAMAGAPTYCI